MKYLMLMLIVIGSLSVTGQQRWPSGFPIQFNKGWNRWGYAMSDSGLIVANRDTSWLPKFSGTVVYQPSDKKFYWFDSVAMVWNLFGDVIDTTSLSDRINLKLNTSDTTNKWWGVGRRWVDSLYRVNDSTVGFAINGSTYTFEILGRASGGGGGGSGTVTSVTLSMPSAFSVSGSPITSSGTFNVSGAGTSGEYIRGNGTLATTDTGMIPDFYFKVRGLFSGLSPITYNSNSGEIGINNANTFGTKGAATFSNADFSDNGSGTISLSTLVSAGGCTGCNLTIDAKGRISAYSNGSAGATNNTNIGDGLRILNSNTQEMRTLFGGFGVNIDSTSNEDGLAWSADTTRGTGLPTYYYVDSVSSGGGLDLLADSTGSKIQVAGDSTFVLNTGMGGIYDSTVFAYPGDTLQRKLETVRPYGRLLIMPGTYILPLDTLNSVMYVDTSNITIEFAPGSYVKIQDSSNSIIDSVEINRNYGPQTGLNDIQAQTSMHPPIVGQSITVTITSIGTPNQYTVSGASSGNGIYDMTGAFQAIGTTGIEVNFGATTGHTINDLWTLITSSTPATIVRIGQGFQDSTIRNTNIIGNGVLDGNAYNQYPVNGQAAESNYTIGIFGRVVNTTIKDVTVINSERSIFASGRTTGTFNNNGTVTGGVSYDVYGLNIMGVNSRSNTSGFLFGHPSYRGATKNVMMTGCTVINNTSLATVEPNLFCDSFVITNNYIENTTGGSSLHMWRAPSNGKIFNNIIRGTTGDNAPVGWYRSFGLNNWADYDNNLFSLSQQNAINSGTNSSRIGLGTTTPTTKFQVVGPHVSGQGLANFRGNGTVGVIVLNTALAPGLTGLDFQSGGGSFGGLQVTAVDSVLRLFNTRYSAGFHTLMMFNNGNMNVGAPPTTKPTTRFQVRDTMNAPTNTVRKVATFSYKWGSATPTPFAGLGVGVDFAATNGVSNSEPKTIASIEVPYTDGTLDSEDADIVFKAIRNGVITEAGRFKSTGQQQLSTYTTSDFLAADTAAYKPAVFDASGNIYRMSGWPGRDGNGIYGGSGSLSAPTTITGGTNTLTLTGAKTSGAAFIVQNAGAGNAVSIAGDGGATALISNTGSGNGLQITSNNGTALNVTSDNTNAATFNINPTSTNTTERVTNYVRRTTGVAANDMGASLGFSLEDAAGLTYEAGVFAFTQTDATNRTTNISINTLNSGTSSTKLMVAGNGQFRLNNYTSSSAFAGTAVALLSADVNGNVLTGAVGDLLQWNGSDLRFHASYMTPLPNTQLFLKSRMKRLSFTVPDADFSTLSTRQEGYFILPEITANRTFDMFSGTAVDGVEFYIYNANTSGVNSWSFTGVTPQKASDGTSVSAIVNGVLYHVLGVYDGTTARWVIVNQ